MADKRERGPILCKPGSKLAKRIESTHGFQAAMKAREKREAGKSSTDEKGDS